VSKPRPAVRYIVTDGDDDTATTALRSRHDDVPTAGHDAAETVTSMNLTQPAFDQSFDAATDAASAGFFDAVPMARWRSMPRRWRKSSPGPGEGKYALVTQTNSGPFTGLR